MTNLRVMEERRLECTANVCHQPRAQTLIDKLGLRLAEEASSQGKEDRLVDCDQFVINEMVPALLVMPQPCLFSQERESMSFRLVLVQPSPTATDHALAGEILVELVN